MKNEKGMYEFLHGVVASYNEYVTSEKERADKIAKMSSRIGEKIIRAIQDEMKGRGMEESADVIVAMFMAFIATGANFIDKQTFSTSKFLNIFEALLAICATENDKSPDDLLEDALKSLRSIF